MFRNGTQSKPQIKIPKVNPRFSWGLLRCLVRSDLYCKEGLPPYLKDTAASKTKADWLSDSIDQLLQFDQIYSWHIQFQ